MMVNVLTGERIDEEEVVATKKVSAESLIEYLQGMMDDYKKEEEWCKGKEGMAEYLGSKIDAMIACKEMVECMIGLPVNLRRDGKVTVGF